MKVLVLHPPMYPVNYEFYNHLGEYVELTVYQVAQYPNDHLDWTSSSLSKLRKNFDLKVFGKGSNSFKNQILSLHVEMIKSLEPDIVMSIAFWIPSFYYSILSKILNFKFIILTNAIEATEQRYLFLRKLYRRIICNNTTSFISASELTSKYLMGLCAKTKIRLSVQTIEVKNWRDNFALLDTKENLRKKLNLPLEKKIMLGVGNFYYKKNWLSAIRLFENIEDSIFILVGSGEDGVEYARYIKKHKLQNKVIIVGRKNGLELQEYYKASDVFILPSIMETFGFVVVEALASGLPVLCSKYAGASTLIKSGYNGYIIDSKKNFISEINSAILNLDYLRKNAYKSIENLTLKNRAKEFYDIFQKELKN